MDRERFPMIQDFPPEVREKLRHLVRHALENGICTEAVAFRFGNAWRIDRERLPSFLAGLTQKILEREAKRLRDIPSKPTRDGKALPRGRDKHDAPSS